MPDDPRPRPVPAPPSSRPSEPLPDETSSGRDVPDLVDRVRERLDDLHDREPEDQVTGYQELEASLREALRTAGEDS